MFIVFAAIVGAECVREGLPKMALANTPRPIKRKYLYDGASDIKTAVFYEKKVNRYLPGEVSVSRSLGDLYRDMCRELSTELSVREGQLSTSG